MKAESIQRVEGLCVEVLELIQKRRGEADYGPKLSGELRRRSMDLTRALAEMRKP